VKLGTVHFNEYDTDALIDVYGACRGLRRDVRRFGCYGLSNLLGALEGELVRELNHREYQAAQVDERQMRLVDDAA